MLFLSQHFIIAVGKYCFGAEGEHHGSTAMSRTQSRACLAVGSLARHADTAGHHQVAHGLMDRLEDWLHKHGQGGVQS